MTSPIRAPVCAPRLPTASDQLTPISATQGLLAALRAACELLHAAPDGLDVVSVVGRLRPGSTALPLLARAESLASEFEFGVLMRLSAGAYEIRFRRAVDAPE